MLLIDKYKWQDPLEIARNVPDNEKCWVFLYSAMKYNYSGDYSFLALNAKSILKDQDFLKLDEKLTKGKAKYDNAWFGYLSYGLKNNIENLYEDEKSYVNFDNLFMANFSLILVFNHKAKYIEIWADKDHSLSILDKLFLQKKKTPIKNIKADLIGSNMTKELYFKNVNKIKNLIYKGDIYQANLTRKFYAKINKNIRKIDIFANLCQISPAPYASFIKIADKYIISSSPERFLFLDKDGNANMMPIKGSAPRHSDKKKDKILFENLKNSEKDKAENLMIVDLSRNDLSKSSILGSVKVKGLYEIFSYSTIYHMISTIISKKSKDISSLDLVKNCFPPGSMTGAPKIKAMQICSEIEKLDRGVYSGAIGWFAGDGSLDLSVVIRTILIDGDKLEFQVGGAIIADSSDELEWKETMIKAKAMVKALGIDIKEIENI